MKYNYITIVLLYYTYIYISYIYVHINYSQMYILLYYNISQYCYIPRLNLSSSYYSFASISHTEHDNYANVILKMLGTNCTEELSI